MKSFKQIKTIAIAIVLACSSGSSAAIITFEGYVLSRDVNYQHNAVFETNQSAGQMSITLDGAPFIAYCVDLDNDAPSQWQATLQPVSVINGGKAIAYLFDHFAAGVTTDNQAAALQVAIWEVVDDSPGVLNLTADHFRFTAASQGQFANVMAQAVIYLAAIPADLTNYFPQSFIIHSSVANQAQHLIVPEPASLSILAVGAMFVLRRSRR